MKASIGRLAVHAHQGRADDLAAGIGHHPEVPRLEARAPDGRGEEVLVGLALAHGPLEERVLLDDVGGGVVVGRGRADLRSPSGSGRSAICAPSGRVSTQLVQRTFQPSFSRSRSPGDPSGTGLPITVPPSSAGARAHPGGERRTDPAAAVRRVDGRVAAPGLVDLGVGDQGVAVEDAHRRGARRRSWASASHRRCRPARSRPCRGPAAPAAPSPRTPRRRRPWSTVARSAPRAGPGRPRAGIQPPTGSGCTPICADRPGAWHDPEMTPTRRIASCESVPSRREARSR